VKLRPIARVGHPSCETMRQSQHASSAGLPALKPLLVRPMAQVDLAVAATISAASLGIGVRDEPAASRWRERVGHALSTDPGGAFVAERAGRVIGVAQAICRERLWCLSLLSVQPGVQSAGAGRALLERALAYDGGTDCGLIVSSNDPRALRLYALAGFSLLPTFQAEGTIDRRSLPRPNPRVREADADLERLEPISRQIRGAPHTREIEYAVGSGARVMRLDDRGFVVADAARGVWLLAARDAEAATVLLWSGLELCVDADGRCIRWITGEQDWAIGVAVQARLRITAYGALAVRGRPGSMRPFIPSGPFA
jgi:ribosomal protein S18 acetylase RimI-like enzyme